jgi:integrase
MDPGEPSIAKISWSNFETTKQNLDPEEVVELLAELSSSRPILTRLQHLTQHSSDTRFLGAVLYLISTPEAQSILSEWAPENRHAAGLANLGRTCWGEQLAIAALRPFKEDQRVASEFGKRVESQYLAAMAASRRALPAGPTSSWVQRLRIYIVIRAIDALEAGVVRESHLLEICRAIRLACETTGYPTWEWLETVAGGALGYQGFVAEAILRCRTALNDRKGKPGKAFFEQLLYVLENRGWKRLSGNDLQIGSLALEPYASGNERSALANLDAFKDSTSTTFRTFHGLSDDDISAAGKHRTNPKYSPKKQIQHGYGLRLVHIERSLFLPHSWHQLTRTEETALFARTRELLATSNLANQFGAASTQIALLCSQTMHDISVFSLKTGTTEDWSLDLKNNQLVRLAPRFARRWRHENAKSDAISWLHPLSDQWTIRLAPNVCKPIRLAKLKVPDATSFGELWAAIGNDETLAIWFNKHFTNHSALSRVTSPCLLNPAAMHVFQQTRDLAFARLVTSDSRTALPSPCAYAAYRAPKVLDSLGVFAKSELAELIAPIVNEDLNVAGSELDIRLNLLRVAIDNLVQKVACASTSSSWVEHHNQLTALTVLSLLASTGARPVNSPFESFAWIDLVRGLLYVEDKNSGPTQGSRICVLSDCARALLEQQYIPHLRGLANAFRQNDPAFLNEIDAIFDPNSEALLPQFFFLREKPGIDWFEVSECELERVCQFVWPLPWNLFRHLTSTWLCRWGLHPDIRDALLGHADRDAEPHGYFSPRIPIDDLEQARPLVNRLAQEVGFVIPGDWPLPILNDDLFLSRSNPGYSRQFGRKARALRRQHSLESAQDLARAVIAAKLGDRSLAQLSAEEVDGIALAMLFREDGLPHAMGSIRYEVFETFLAERWQKYGEHAKVNRRYTLISQGHSLFNEEAIDAEQKITAFRESFEAFVAPRSPTSERPVIAATMAAIELVLESKVANFQALCALLCNHHSVRLVHFDQRYWFEWAFGARWEDGKPMFRVGVTNRAAQWMSKVLGSRSLNSVPDMPAPMSAVFSSLSNDSKDLAQLIRLLAGLQSQVNALSLSGIEAGYLCGARPSAALPHADWIRLVKGAALVSPGETKGAPAADSANELEQAEYFFRHHHKHPIDNNKGTALERCKALFKLVYDGLNSDDTNPKIATAIAKGVRASGFARGDAPFLLAHFAVHLLKRKPKRGTKDRLRSATALRYWESLAPAFLDIAADVNLTDAEEEDLTDLYDQVIKATDAPRPSEVDDPSIGPKNPIEFSNSSDAPLRALTQLREFHEFVGGTYGLPDLDWAEISPDISIGVGRPGIVMEQEYLAILHRLLDGKSPAALDQDTLSAAFVLIVCARFGLRIGEAVGLNRCDWIQIAHTLTILVRSNPTRTLKTIRSKRKVPQIETLTEVEANVVSVILERWTHREGVDLRTPLLPGVSRSTFKAVKSEIGSRLLDSIKTITRHDGSTVHMLRHAFAMRILSLLWCKPLNSATPADAQKSEDARRLLTGTPDIDKRLLWAVSRLLGHASPGVTLKSYVNCLHIWIAPSTASRLYETLLIPVQAIDLDRLALAHDYLSSKSIAGARAEVHPEPVFLRCMRTVRLIGVGHDAIQAYRHSGITPEQGTRLISELTRVSARLQKNESRFGIFNLLYGIPTPRLNALVRIAEEATPSEGAMSALEEWDLTIGPSRQILLFKSDHFVCLAAFRTLLKLASTDIWLISKSPRSISYSDAIAKAELTDFLRVKSDVCNTFQLDVAAGGNPPQTWPERLVAVPAKKGRLDSTYELLVLWIVWHVSLHIN